MEELFSTAVETIPQYLHIIHNDKECKESFDNLLDTSLFETALICTYVSSSPEFTFEKLKNFKNVKLIVGQEEAGFSFNSSITAATEMTDTFLEEKIANVSADIIEKIIKEQIQIRYARANEIIHSKIYILKGKKITRVIVGSANFSRKALYGGKQFEELIVYDSNYNSSFVNIYENRFQYIWDLTTDVITTTFKKFLNERIKEIQKVSVKASNSSGSKIDRFLGSQAVLLDNETKANIITEKINNQINVVDNFQEILENSAKDVDNIKGIMEKVVRKASLVVNITRKDGKRITVKPINKIRNNARKLVSTKINFKYSINKPIDEEFKDGRNFLFFDNVSKMLMIKEENDIEIYPKPIDIEELRPALEQISRFIESYSLFSSVRNEQDAKDIEAKVFQVILYAFTSPFIWMMRRDLKETYPNVSEKIAEIPPFLIVGGNAGTGKTKLLLFINRLLGNKQDIYTYQKIDNRGKTLLQSFFESNNVFPVIVDEIARSMFRDSGENVIKYVANEIVDQHPCFIGATNQEFTTGAQVIRRMFYIDFPYPIRKESKKEADAYFNNEVHINDVNDKLFRSFLYEFQRRMEENDLFYKMEDPLFLGRQIFKDFYKQAEMDIPMFISDETFNDYYKKGARSWAAFYMMNKDKPEIIQQQGDVLFVDLLKFYSGAKNLELEQQLPPYVVSSKGNPLILFKDAFFEFISDAYTDRSIQKAKSPFWNRFLLRSSK